MNEERSPLVWPSQQTRTRVQDQKNNGAWKKTCAQYLSSLELELTRMGSTRFAVTWNDPRKCDGRDPGVAVWFSRKKGNEWRWQDILGIENPYPTVDDIDTAFKRRVKAVHPDLNPGADRAPYDALVDARKQAIDFVRGTMDLPKDFVIASDQYKEARQNLYAIIGTIQSLRRIERLGATQLFEGALHGFAGALPQTASESSHEPTATR